MRQTSATGTPSSPCFRINAFWASENFDAFIASTPSPSRKNTAENSNSKRSSSQGAEQKFRVTLWRDGTFRNASKREKRRALPFVSAAKKGHMNVTERICIAGTRIQVSGSPCLTNDQRRLAFRNVSIVTGGRPRISARVPSTAANSPARAAR
ncbi:hypothetical protein FF124_17140 [Martelella lutilitoris]|uniref:Uncharacterized protein n=1 Tax=Martelella lutilitoris TaxID=2583532 RepID=A0A5C4JPZ5_9HYPH|nr:hypothetical protein FF124_17140 [Martelella lutilitoris]